MGKKKGGERMPSPNNTKCPRCNGAMVYERFQYMLELFYAWRCLNCGEIVDPVVVRNRGAEKKPKKRAVG
jgi:hypothetical protein